MKYLQSFRPGTKKIIVFVAFAIALVLLLSKAAYILFFEKSIEPRKKHQKIDEATVIDLPADPERRGFQVVDGSISSGQPFTAALLAAGIHRTACDSIQLHLDSVRFKFRQCLPGQTFTAHFDSCGLLQGFRYDVDKLLSYVILRNQGGRLFAVRRTKAVEKQLVAIEGSVTTSVYQTILSLGETAQIVADYADVLGYDIDFIFDPRVGDCFSILVEKHLLDGEIVGYGKILAASYTGEITGDVCGYYYRPDSTFDGWFAPDGENLQKAFMRSPLSILRVTSNFGMRTHPITGNRKMHTGIDYGAPTGTPVWSVGSGTVVYSGWKGGYGKTIEVKHAGGVKTRYGHLSRINVKVGQAVRQHQTIGAVGSTGLSTGPHLHFEYLVGGKFVAPRKIKNPALKRLSEENMAAFTKHIERTDSIWSAAKRVTMRIHGSPLRVGTSVATQE